MADGMWLNKSFKNSILQRIAKCELDGKRYVYSSVTFSTTCCNKIKPTQL